MPVKSSESNRVSQANEAYDLLIKAAGPQIGVKQLLLSAHRKLSKHGWSFNRVKDVYHRDPRIRIRADEIAQLRILADANTEKQAHSELSKLESRISRLEALLRTTDAEFYRDQMDALDISRGGRNRPLAKRLNDD